MGSVSANLSPMIGTEMVGKVLWFDVKKGFGFIKAEDKDYFVHYSKIQSPIGEFKVLCEGDTVEFEPFAADRGDGHTKLQAKNIKIVETIHAAV